jgi:hypothetical protein
MKGKSHATTFEGKSSHVNFNWARKENGLKSLAPIASNKNGQWFNRNLITMINVISAQLPRYAIAAMSFIKMKPFPWWEIKRMTYQRIKKSLQAIQIDWAQESSKDLQEGQVEGGEPPLKNLWRIIAWICFRTMNPIAHWHGTPATKSAVSAIGSQLNTSK